MDGLRGEIEHLRHRQVGVHILVKNVHKAVELGQTVPGQGLLGQSHQQGLLGLGAAHVGIARAVVVLAETGHLHGLLAV